MQIRLLRVWGQKQGVPANRHAGILEGEGNVFKWIIVIAVQLYKFTKNNLAVHLHSWIVRHVNYISIKLLKRERRRKKPRRYNPAYIFSHTARLHSPKNYPLVKYYCSSAYLPLGREVLNLKPKTEKQPTVFSAEILNTCECFDTCETRKYLLMKNYKQILSLRPYLHCCQRQSFVC